MSRKPKLSFLKIVMIIMMAAMAPLPMPWIDRQQISKVRTEQIVRRDDDDPMEGWGRIDEVK